MNLLTVLKEIDTDQFNNKEKDSFLSRKDALGKISSFSKKLALAAVPTGAVAMFSKPALAQSNDSIMDALNFALTLEYLEATYYQTGVDTDGLIPEAGQTIYNQINQHEQAHVEYLQGVINQLGGTPVPRDNFTFDFTAGGAFDPFNNYDTFLTLSQAFEDTGVRAYKGQGTMINSSPLVLTRALQVHSVEARHAAEVRRLRGLNGYITGGPEGEGVPEAASGVYEGEANTTQAGITLSNIISDDGDVSNDDLTAAWDEPATMDDVFAVANLFIA